MKRACLAHLLARAVLLSSIELWASATLAETRDIEPGADLPSLAQQAADGDVLRLKPGRYAGPVLIDGKHLSIEGPATGEAIIGFGQSNVVLAAVNGGVLDLSAVSVETSAESPLGLFAQGGSISCAKCQVRGAAGSAVYAESGSMTFDGGMISVPSGTAFLALSGSTVRISGAKLRSETGSPLVAQETAAVEISGSTFEGLEGTVLTGATARISIDRSEFTASGGETNGLHVETGADLGVTETRMRGGRFGLAVIVQPETKASLMGGTAAGGSGGLYFEQQPPEAAHATVEVTIENILAIASGTGNDSIALRAIGPLAIVARQSTFLSGGIAAVAATGGAKLTVERGILSAVETAAAAYGNVPGEARLVGAIVVPPASAAAPGVVSDILTGKLALALRTDAALGQSFTTAITEALAGGQADKFAALAEQVNTAAAGLATIGFEVADGAGRAMAVPFSVVTLDGEAAAESADGKPVPVAAGAYLVEGKSDAALASDIDIAAGEDRTVRVEAPDALWFDINQQKEGLSRLVLFQPVEPDQARAILRAASGGYSYGARIFRRSDLARVCLGDCPADSSDLPLQNRVTETDVALALEAARDLVAMELKWPADGTDADKNRFGTWDDAVFTWALPALASFGTQADAALMLDFYRRRDWSGRDFLDHLAYLEHRLGLLGTGQLASLATDPELPAETTAKALLLLDYYGVSGAREKLVELIQNPERFDALTSFREAIAGRAARMDWPEFPAIAASLLQRAAEKARLGTGNKEGLFIDSTIPVAIHLALSGTPEQKRIVTDEMFRSTSSRWRTWPQWTRLAGDPTDFVREKLEDQYDEGSQLFFICPWFRARANQAFETLVDNMVAEFANHAVAVAATKPYDRHPDVIYKSADLTTRFMLGSCRPDADVARIYYEDMAEYPNTAIPGNWYPGFRAVEPLREFMARKSLFTDGVQSTSPALVLEVWDSLQVPPWSDFKEERMALFRAFTKSGDVFSNALIADGVERRPYVVRHIIPGEYSGALAGHVEIRPSNEDGKLVIGVRLNQHAYYNSFGGLADAIGTEGGNRDYWANHAYFIDGGRKLIEKIALTRGSEAIALTEGPAAEADGTFRFATGLPADDLSNLVLKVDLAMFEDRRSFEFDLFASSFALDQGARP